MSLYETPRAPASGASQAHLAHQALDRAARHADALAPQLLVANRATNPEVSWKCDDLESPCSMTIRGAPRCDWQT
jgi:hypothetical protein